MAKPTITAAQAVLLGAKDLNDGGRQPFSEWDLTVAVWQRDPNRFGCRGYEDQYPDHKRVMMEIMGGTKDNPLRRGWMRKVRPNFYELTDLGRADAEKLTASSTPGSASHRSAQPIYDAIEPYFSHSVFRRFCRDESEPRTWLGAASFLGITRNDALHFEDRLRALKAAIAAGLDWLAETGEAQMNRGVTAGGVAITAADLRKLQSLVTTIEERFAIQIAAIRKTR
jgi:hypothetical protein